MEQSVAVFGGRHTTPDSRIADDDDDDASCESPAERGFGSKGLARILRRLAPIEGSMSKRIQGRWVMIEIVRVVEVGSAPCSSDRSYWL